MSSQMPDRSTADGIQPDSTTASTVTIPSLASPAILTPDSTPSKEKAESFRSIDNQPSTTSKSKPKGQTEEEILATVVETLPMRQLAPAFLAVALTMFMAALDNSIVSTALPRIGTDFAASNRVEQVFSFYVITFNGFQSLYGRFSNVFGRKPTVFVAIFVFLLGSILSGASQSMNMFLACRALTGAGAGGIFSLSNIIIADLVSLRDRGKFQGAISSIFAISALTGPVLGGALVDHISWRWCFFIQIGLAVFTIPTLYFMLKLPRPSGNVWEKLKKIDWLGTLLLGLVAVFVLLPTNLGGTVYAWNSPLVITMFALVIPTTVAFLYVEAYVAKQPVVPPYLWKNRNVVTLLAINICMGATFWGVTFYIPIYLQISEHMSATTAGLTMIPVEVGIFVASNIVGILVSKYGKFRPYVSLGTAMAVVGSSLCLILIRSGSKIVQVVILLVFGSGIGPLFPALIVAIQASVERKDLATVSILHNFFRMTGSGFGVAIAGALFNNHLDRELINAQIPEEFAIQAKTSAQTIVLIPELYRGTVESVYLDSLQVAFTAIIPFACGMFLLSFFLKHVRLNVKKEEGSKSPVEETTTTATERSSTLENEKEGMDEEMGQSVDVVKEKN